MRHNSQVSLYQRDVAILKSYRGKLKLILCRSVRQKGFEVEVERKARGTSKEEKEDCNIARTRSRIFELCFCNPWEMFVTLTLDANKYDRTDLDEFRADLTQWLRDYNKKHKIAIKYLLIPELHKDGKSWHMHGLIMGLPKEHLVLNEHGYSDWLPYRKKFGWISIDDEIRSHEGVSKYMTKYISKDLNNSVKDLNANMYYCSKGLERAKEIKRGTLAATNIPFDFENDYCKVKWLNDELSSRANDLID